MTISESIARYTIYKNEGGVLFDSGNRYLVSFTRRVGDIDHRLVTAEDVMTFLNDSKAQSSTWRLKYGVFIRFCDFWASRGEMPYLSFPPPKPKVRQRFVSYVYSGNELRLLFRAMDLGRQTHIVIEGITMRSLMLFLYGTGTLVSEAINLKIEDVDSKIEKSQSTIEYLPDVVESQFAMICAISSSDT